MDEVRQEIEVAAPRDLVYELWRDPDTFVEIMGALRDAELDGETLHWEAEGPFGMTMRGEAELVEQTPPDRLAWESTNGALEARGSVSFEEQGEATRVQYELRYSVAGGGVGKAVAGALADPAEQVRTTLERFRELAERRAQG